MSSLAPDQGACERTAGPRAILDIGYVVLSETASKTKGSSGRGDGGRGGRLEQGCAGWRWAEGEEWCIRDVDLSNVET